MPERLLPGQPQPPYAALQAEQRAEHERRGGVAQAHRGERRGLLDDDPDREVRRPPDDVHDAEGDQHEAERRGCLGDRRRHRLCHGRPFCDSCRG